MTNQDKDGAVSKAPTTESKTPITRTPRDSDSILRGLLKLTLKEQTDICRQLKDHIKAAVEKVSNQAKASAEMASGL